MKRLLFLFVAITVIAAFTYKEPSIQQIELPAPEPVAHAQTTKTYGTVTLYEPCGVPAQIDTSRKVWMDYRTITDRTSDQWKLQRRATTDENGLRKFDNRYMVAVGTYYAARCGVYLTIVFEDGTFIDAVVGDIKQNIHTDAKNQYTPISKTSGNVVEFIVDTDHLNRDALVLGDISPIGLHGNVVEILKEVEYYQI